MAPAARRPRHSPTHVPISGSCSAWSVPRSLHLWGIGQLPRSGLVVLLLIVGPLSVGLSVGPDRQHCFYAVTAPQRDACLRTKRSLVHLEPHNCHGVTSARRVMWCGRPGLGQRHEKAGERHPRGQACAQPHGDRTPAGPTLEPGPARCAGVSRGDGPRPGGQPSAELPSAEPGVFVAVGSSGTDTMVRVRDGRG